MFTRDGFLFMKYHRDLPIKSVLKANFLIKEKKWVPRKLNFFGFEVSKQNFRSEFDSKALREESCFATNEDLSKRSITLAKQASEVKWQLQRFAV